jgi:hypothetical protein
MKILKLTSLLALAISVVGGCILISGQFFIDWELPNISVQQDNLTPFQVDLNEEEEYRDHKDDLQGLADLAFVGFVTNNLGTAVEGTIYITPATTNFTSKAAMIASGQATRLWGDFPLAANEQNKKIDWDQSAELFDDTGFDVLVGEIKGDGSFTLYLVGAQGTFDLSTNNNWLMIVVDANG